ncbi:MAG: radical SAM protein, partial [Eubacterium aggregans]
MEDLTLKQYLEDAIRHLSQNIVKATVKNPQTSLAMARFAKGRRAAEARRESYQIQGTNVPPFLIASV